MLVREGDTLEDGGGISDSESGGGDIGEEGVQVFFYHGPGTRIGGGLLLRQSLVDIQEELSKSVELKK